MAFNGSGTFVRLYNWVTDKINLVPITASRFDAEMDGMATGLSTCITKDGQTTITANIPMASHKFTGLSTGNARTDSLTLGQVQDGQFTDLGTSGGAADAYTAAPAPTVTAYAATMRYTVKIHTPNLTTTPYLQLSAIASPSTTAVVKKLDASGAEIAVQAGDLNGIHDFKRNAANDAFIVLNPQKPFFDAVNLTNVVNSINSDGVNNLGLATSVASSALTIALKTKAGTDPSATDVVKIGFRNATAGTGTYNIRSITGALSLVISSGSTLGTVSAIASYLYVYAIDNAGTIELAVSSTPFEDGSIRSTTAEGGAGAADSKTALYSTTARTDVPVRLIARLLVTEATAGTWATNSSLITLIPKIPASFESETQTITLAGSLTIAHSLGVQPKRYQGVLKCTSAEGNYSVGDETNFKDYDTNDNGPGYGVQIVPDATNLNVRFGDTKIVILNKTTGAAFTIDITKWVAIFRAASTF